MRTSSPGSTTTSPRTMIPPHNPFANNAAASSHLTTLAAPNPPLTGSRSPGYSSHSYSHSTSPSTGSGSLPELPPQDQSMMMISPTQISSASLNAQKRAYRQRRKDPSCDACRERKVKCDATETSACSECSSRNHKCQFTKETNRRMSSIKQVQDLQSQIADLAQQNLELQKAAGAETTAYERAEPKRRHFEARSETSLAPQRMTAPVMNNFEHVRDNIREHSRGIFSTPHARDAVSKQNGCAQLEAPQRHDYAQLSRAYLDSIHEWYPVLHWSTFERQVDDLYTNKSFNVKTQEWIGLFFAVLACGTLLHGPTDNSPSGTDFFELATKSLTPWPHVLAIEHAQAAFLLSIFATEQNNRTVGSMWLGSAARAAQELNIHCATSTGSWIDIETRRRLWWAIYTRDRITSLDSHRPMLINEGDCDTPLPSHLEDRSINPSGFARRPSAGSTPITGPLAVLQVTRLYAPLYQALKSSVIDARTFKSLDDEFQRKLLLLPESHRMDYTGPLDATAFPPLFSLLSAQFHLYRRNLTPLCTQQVRAEALSRCVAVAQETAKYISRTLYSPTRSDSEKNWHTRVALVASNMACLHLWRCMLVLCFRGDYDAAFMCLHVSTAIGKTRKINSACGKHLVFFLDQMLNRVRSGRGSPQQLEHDEEILAYVSGDVQASIDHSWVWAGPNNTTPSPPSQSSSFDTTRSRGGDEPMRDVLSVRTAGGSPTQAEVEWNEWTRIEHMIRQLLEENRPRSSNYYPPPHNPMKRVQLAHETKLAPKPPPPASPAPSSSSRISIANII